MMRYSFHPCAWIAAFNSASFPSDPSTAGFAPCLNGSRLAAQCQKSPAALFIDLPGVLLRCVDIGLIAFHGPADIGQFRHCDIECRCFRRSGDTRPATQSRPASRHAKSERCSASEWRRAWFRPRWRRFPLANTRDRRPNHCKVLPSKIGVKLCAASAIGSRGHEQQRRQPTAAECPIQTHTTYRPRCPTYTRPPPTAGALKCENPRIVSRAREQHIAGGWRRAHKRWHGRPCAFRSSTFSRLPFGPNCTGESPSDNAKTIPLAMITGVGTDMFSEFQAGVSTGLPACTSTLNAITLPSGVSPCCNANLVAGAGGPQAGAYSQRVPAASSQVEKAPQNPFPAKFTSSFVSSGLRYSGVS